METFKWNLFLRLVRENKIIPIIGSDLILVQKDNKIIPFYNYLTQKLGEKLEIDPGLLNFREFILEHKNEDFLSEAIEMSYQEIIDEGVLFDDHLKKLARISGFIFYISTTLDKIFESFLRKERGTEDQKIQVVHYSYPNKAISEKDLPKKGHKPTVFNILGTMEVKVCAITDEEILEYVFSLKNESPLRDFLFNEIEGKNLLFLGCDFPDWLHRFFIRILTNEPFIISEIKTEKIIADNYSHKDTKLSLFLKRFRTQIIDLSNEEYQNPIVFINEFYEKWKESDRELIPKRYEGTVFLSFNSKNRKEIIPIRDELIAQGIDPWYDESDLHAGDNYEMIIRDKIAQCALFIPFIAEASISDPKSFAYSIEWDMAIARRKLREYDKVKESFILPVIIDDTQVTDDRIPVAFRQVTIDKMDKNILINHIKNKLNLVSNEG